MRANPDKKRTSEAELRALAIKGMNFVEIATELGMPVAIIRNVCSALGIQSRNGQRSEYPKKGGPRKNAAPVDLYLADLRAGMTLGAIATKHGRANPSVVFSALRRRGLPTNARAVSEVA